MTDFWKRKNVGQALGSMYWLLIWFWDVGVAFKNGGGWMLAGALTKLFKVLLMSKKKKKMKPSIYNYDNIVLIWSIVIAEISSVTCSHAHTSYFSFWCNRLLKEQYFLQWESAAFAYWRFFPLHVTLGKCFPDSSILKLTHLVAFTCEWLWLDT